MGLKDIFFGNDEEAKKEPLLSAEESAAAEAAGAAAAAAAMAQDDAAEKSNEGEKKDLVTADMLVGEIIQKHPSTATFLMDCGMECIFCPASQMESLAEACAVHGIDADEIVAAINEKLEEYAN